MMSGCTVCASGVSPFYIQPVVHAHCGLHQHTAMPYVSLFGYASPISFITLLTVLFCDQKVKCQKLIRMIQKFQEKNT